MEAKKSIQKKQWNITERSDADRHDRFDPDKMGLEDWGDGFFVNPEPVLIERGAEGQIVRTTPMSQVPLERLFPGKFQDGELIEADKPTRPAQSRLTQEKIIEMMAAYLMTHFSKFAPGQLPYNPLYDGIPLSESTASRLILDPHKSQAVLTHVPAHEVHEWLRKILAKRATMINAKTGNKGWGTNLEDTVIHLEKSR